MKIGNNIEDLSRILASQNSSASQAAHSHETKSSATSSLSPVTDTAHLSQIAEQLTQASSAPDVRPDKVAAIQRALAAGTYSVPPSQVAAKLVDSMLQRNE